MKLALIVFAIVQIAIATQTDGLYRALAELAGFVAVVALVVRYRKEKKSKLVIEPEEL
ncbi:hypothetical protein [Vibrio rhodolitus]|uniref:hypothetical protein n=1 Tax=Vibrio rhodolitus TaxID=2231649 RepID=UPI0013DED080|nr:hypothetical protein [Vibrio rhodolitus]